MMPRLLQSLLQSRGLDQIIALLVILAVDRAVSPQFFDLRMQDGRLFGSLIDVLNRGATGYGALTSSIGIGAVIGALGIALASARIRARGRLMLIGGTAFGILLILFSASRVLALSMVLLGLAGCAMIVNNSLTNTLIQTTAPDHLRGRVMGFYSFVFVGMAPFGAFLFGLVAQHVGVPATLAAGGAIVALAVMIAGRAVPEIRTS